MGHPLAGNLEPLERAVGDTYPWAVKPLGSDDWCYLSNTSPAADTAGVSGDSHPYVCQTPDRSFITQDPAKYFADPTSIHVTLKDVPDKTDVIFGLTRSGGHNEQWSGQRVTTPSSVSRAVSISAVEY